MCFPFLILCFCFRFSLLHFDVMWIELLSLLTLPVTMVLAGGWGKEERGEVARAREMLVSS